MIVNATRSDYPRLAEIWESAVKATHHFLPDEDFRFYQSRLSHYFDAVSLFTYKDTRGRIQGFMGISGHKIEMLFVDNKFRGEGIGKCLLLHAVNHLGASLVDVNEQNQQAVGFYQHEGFKVTGHSPIDGEGKSYPLLHLEKLTCFLLPLSFFFPA